VRIEALSAARFEAWTRLFDACTCTCYCRYWHFAGDKNAWLERCATEPEASREEMLAALRDPQGLIATEDERVLGWMKLVPRASLPKLRAQSVYRALDLGSDDGVYSVGCFLVHPEHRQRGVARALLAAAPDHVRALGGRAIEAYPRRWPEPLRDDEVWLGPLRLFEELGFSEVKDPRATRQYPVYFRLVT
jgi:GNAT superfamily N-acetyltransferase